MPDYFYHYTSRHNAQGILAVGEIKPRVRGSRVYLTDTLYSTGAEASDNLGIDEKSVEICFAIDRYSIAGLSASSKPACGKAQRRGGANEWYTFSNVDAKDAVILEVRTP